MNNIEEIEDIIGVPIVSRESINELDAKEILSTLSSLNDRVGELEDRQFESSCLLSEIDDLGNENQQLKNKINEQNEAISQAVFFIGHLYEMIKDEEHNTQFDQRVLSDSIAFMKEYE